MIDLDAAQIILLAAIGLPLAAWWLVILLTNPHYSIIGILVLSFTRGIGEILGVQPFYFKLVIEFSIMLLFLTICWQRSRYGKRMLYPGGFWVAIFASISIMSFVLNHVPLTQFLYFVRIIFVPYFFLVLTANIPWYEKNRNAVLKTIIYLYLLQLPAALLKLVIIGPAEPYIGTISILDGSITTVLVLLATTCLAVNYAATSKTGNLVLLAAFVIFGMIGLKRALIVFVPVIWLLSMLMYSWRQGNKKIMDTLLKPQNIRNTTIALVGGMVVFYAVVRLNPTLNPEGIIGGSFDMEFVVNYSLDYNSREGRDKSQYIGRASAPEYVWKAVADKGLPGALFGLGAGIITASRFVEGSREYLSSVIGLGYGARNGIWYLLLQVGVLGVGAYFFFIFFLIRKAGHLGGMMTNKSDQCLALICQISLIVYILDTTMYSQSMMMTHALLLPVLWLFAVIVSSRTVVVTNNKK